MEAEVSQYDILGTGVPSKFPGTFIKQVKTHTVEGYEEFHLDYKFLRNKKAHGHDISGIEKRFVEFCEDLITLKEGTTSRGEIKELKLVCQFYDSKNT